MTTEQIVKVGSLLVGVLLVLGIFISFASNGPFIRSELVALDLIPKQETLTELYFQDSSDLSGSAAKNGVAGFTFVIHNLEATDYQYTYEVTVNTNGVRHIVDTRDIAVKDNQYYIKSEEIKLKKASGREEIVVELVNTQQSIHFWIGA